MDGPRSRQRKPLSAVPVQPFKPPGARPRSSSRRGGSCGPAAKVARAWRRDLWTAAPYRSRIPFIRSKQRASNAPSAAGSVDSPSAVDPVRSEKPTVTTSRCSCADSRCSTRHAPPRFHARRGSSTRRSRATPASLLARPSKTIASAASGSASPADGGVQDQAHENVSGASPSIRVTRVSIRSRRFHSG